MRRALATGILRMYGVQALGAGLGLALVPIAAARFGAEGYALWSLYALLQGYIVLAELGLGKNLVQRLAASSDDAQRAQMLRVGAAAYVVVAVIALCLLPVAVLVVGPLFSVPDAKLGAASLIAALSVIDYIVGLPVGLRQSATVARQAFDRYSTFAAAATILRVALPLLAVMLGAGPVVTVAAALVRRVPEWLVARRLLEPIPAGAWPPRVDRGEMRAMLFSALVLSATQAMQVVMISMASVLVGWQGGFAALGQFRTLFDIVSKLWFFSSGIGVVLFPFFSRASAESRATGSAFEILPNAMRASWVAFWCLGIAAVLLGMPVLLRFGIGLDTHPEVFALLVLGMVCNAHANIAYEFLQATRRFDAVLLLNFCGAAVLLLVSLVLPVEDASRRVALAWAVSQLVYALSADGWVYHATGDRDHWISQRALVVVSAACCALPALTGMWWPLLIPGIALGAVQLRGAVRSGRSAWVLLGRQS